MSKRQRPHQHAVDDAEHRGVDADAERQRRQRYRREPRTAAPRAEPEPNVFPQLVHHGSLS